MDRDKPGKVRPMRVVPDDRGSDDAWSMLGWHGPLRTMMLAVGAVALAAFVLVELEHRRQHERAMAIIRACPLLDPSDPNLDELEVPDAIPAQGL